MRARVGCGEMARKSFVKGHIFNVVNRDGRNKHFGTGVASPNWRGGRSATGFGHVTLRQPDHPNANRGKQVLEHVAIAAAALGRAIPKGVEVHHVNEDPSDNSRGNLVICQDHAYHFLLHRRLRALLACGNPNYMKCEICHQYDDPSQLYVSRTRAYRAVHPACNAKGQRDRRARITQSALED
jgi:hypothetical protein